MRYLVLTPCKIGQATYRTGEVEPAADLADLRAAISLGYLVPVVPTAPSKAPAAASVPVATPAIDEAAAPLPQASAAKTHTKAKAKR
jgi:hypothetical protein